MITAECGPTSKTFTLTAVDNEPTVEWTSINSALDTNPNTDGGSRMFPGKESAGDTTARDTVTVKAKICSGLGGVKVYFRAWDVDDPSANTGPIDSNESTGSDNRGTPQAGTLPNPAPGDTYASATTVAGGSATVTFKVTMQPGDNFRVAASEDQTKLGTITQAQADTNSPPDEVGLSKMLTVWRRIHVELDSMKAVPTSESQYNSTANIDSVTLNAPIAGQATVDLGVNLPDSWSDVDHYEEGTIVFAGLAAPNDTFTVYSNTSNVILDDDVVVVGAPGAGAVGATFILDDDDDNQILPQFVGAGNKGDIEYGRAYVKLEYPTAYQDNTAP